MYLNKEQINTNGINDASFGLVAFAKDGVISVTGPSGAEARELIDLQHGTSVTVNKLLVVDVQVDDQVEVKSFGARDFRSTSCPGELVELGRAIDELGDTVESLEDISIFSQQALTDYETTLDVLRFELSQPYWVYVYIGRDDFNGEQVDLIEKHGAAHFYLNVYRPGQLAIFNLAFVALRNSSIKIIADLELVVYQGLISKTVGRFRAYDWSSFQSVASLLSVWYMFVGLEVALLLGEFSYKSLWSAIGLVGVVFYVLLKVLEPLIKRNCVGPKLTGMFFSLARVTLSFISGTPLPSMRTIMCLTWFRVLWNDGTESFVKALCSTKISGSFSSIEIQAKKETPVLDRIAKMLRLFNADGTARLNVSNFPTFQQATDLAKLKVDLEKCSPSVKELFTIGSSGDDADITVKILNSYSSYRNIMTRAGKKAVDYDKFAMVTLFTQYDVAARKPGINTMFNGLLAGKNPGESFSSICGQFSYGKYQLRGGAKPMVAFGGLPATLFSGEFSSGDVNMAPVSGMSAENGGTVKSVATGQAKIHDDVSLGDDNRNATVEAPKSTMNILGYKSVSGKLEPVQSDEFQFQNKGGSLPKLKKDVFVYDAQSLERATKSDVLELQERQSEALEARGLSQQEFERAMAKTTMSKPDFDPAEPSEKPTINVKVPIKPKKS